MENLGQVPIHAGNEGDFANFEDEYLFLSVGKEVIFYDLAYR